MQDALVKIDSILWKSTEDVHFMDLTEDGWLHLHLFWYSICSCRLEELQKKTYDFIIVDGWYYKILARYLVKKSYTVQYLRTLFSRLYLPDMIFYLLVPASECYARKSSFTKCELGGADGHSGNSQDSFIAYQTSVQEKYFDILNVRNNSSSIMKVDNKNINITVSTIFNNLTKTEHTK